MRNAVIGVLGLRVSQSLMTIPCLEVSPPPLPSSHFTAMVTLFAFPQHPSTAVPILSDPLRDIAYFFNLSLCQFPSQVSLFPQISVSLTRLPVLQWPCAHPILWSPVSWGILLPRILAYGSEEANRKDSVQETAKVSQGGLISHPEAGAAMGLSQGQGIL